MNRRQANSPRLIHDRHKRDIAPCDLPTVTPTVMQLDNRLASLLRHFINVGHLGPTGSVSRLVGWIFRLGGRLRAVQIAASRRLVAFHRVALRVAPQNASETRL